MTFIEHFSELSDPRSSVNQQYDLLDIVFLSVCGILAGAEGWRDIERFGQSKLSWLRRFRPMTNGIPVDDTIARTIRALDPEQVTACFIDWVNEVRQQQGQALIAIDGKTLRHSYEESPRDALHAINVLLHEQGLVFCQKGSTGKHNEIRTVQQVIDLLALSESTTVTLDAMHCQKDTARQLTQRNAHYVLCAKANQKGLQEELQWWFDGFSGQWPEGASTFEETDSGHGRVEVRRTVQLPITEQLERTREWPGARSIIRVERERHGQGKPTRETVYYLSSHEPDAAFIAHAIRSHWHIENRVHWVLDVVYREDESRIRAGDGAENFAALRRLALNLARLHPRKGAIRGKLKRAAWDDDFRREILLGINN